MIDFLSQPLPWYVTGPLIGLMVPVLLLFRGDTFGVSSNFRHLCAATLPGRIDYFRYDWKGTGLWQLTLILGVLIGGYIGGSVLANPAPIALSDATIADLSALGIQDFSGFVPADLFSWSTLLSPAGLAIILGGGFLLGFGARYAGGCTSGHAISGLSALQLPSLIAVLGFFAGGLLATYVLLPLLL